MNDLVGRLGGSVLISAVHDHLWFGCLAHGVRFHGRCRGVLVMTEAVMLSEMRERFTVRCTGRIGGRPCRRHKDIDPGPMVKQLGDMPVDAFLRSLRCLSCKTKGAELE